MTKSDAGEEQLDLIDTFHLENVAQEHENEMKHQTSDYKFAKERAKRKAKEEAEKKAKEEADKKKKEDKEKAKKEGKDTEDDKKKDEKKDDENNDDKKKDDKKKEDKKKDKKDEEKKDEKKEEKKEEEKKEEEAEEEYKPTNPKLKISIEFARSGYLAITKAQVASKVEKREDGWEYNHSYNVEVK